MKFTWIHLALALAAVPGLAGASSTESSALRKTAVEELVATAPEGANVPVLAVLGAPVRAQAMGEGAGSVILAGSTGEFPGIQQYVSPAIYVTRQGAEAALREHAANLSRNFMLFERGVRPGREHHYSYWLKWAPLRPGSGGAILIGFPGGHDDAAQEVQTYRSAREYDSREEAQGQLDAAARGLQARGYLVLRSGVTEGVIAHDPVYGFWIEFIAAEEHR